jgi:Protein of unknown function (DUF3040)
VSLPVREQRVLDGIESDLRGCEPRLVSMFATFTRLNRDEGAPPAELRRRGARRRRTAGLGPVIVVPLILGLVGLLVVLSFVAGSAGHGCRAGGRPHPAAATRSLSCPSAQQPAGHGS